MSWIVLHHLTEGIPLLATCWYKVIAGKQSQSTWDWNDVIDSCFAIVMHNGGINQTALGQSWDTTRLIKFFHVTQQRPFEAGVSPVFTTHSPTPPPELLFRKESRYTVCGTLSAWSQDIKTSTVVFSVSAVSYTALDTTYKIHPPLYHVDAHKCTHPYTRMFRLSPCSEQQRCSVMWNQSLKPTGWSLTFSHTHTCTRIYTHMHTHTDAFPFFLLISPFSVCVSVCVVRGTRVTETYIDWFQT